MSDNCCGDVKELVCPTCRNKITDPGTIRCPRCFTLLLKTGCNGNCANCGGTKRRKNANTA